MDSSNGLMQPDHFEATDATSNSTTAQKAPASTCPPLSSINTGLPSPTLHSSRESFMHKRKRAQPPPSDDDRCHPNHTRSRKKIRQHNDDAITMSKRKKSKATTPVDAPASSSSSMPVEDLTTKPSKRLKTKLTIANNAASMPSSSTWPNGSESILTGKTSKPTEQQDASPGPSSSTTYTRSPTPSTGLNAPDPPFSNHAQDEDLEQDITFCIAPPSLEEELIDANTKIDNLADDVDHLNRSLRAACDMLSVTKERLRQAQNEKAAMEGNVQQIRASRAKIGMDAMLERVATKEACRKEVEAERTRRMKANATHKSQTDALTETHNRDMDGLKAKHKVELFEAHAAAAAAKAHAHMLQHKLNNSVMTVSGLEAEVNNGRYLLNAAEEDLQEMAAVKMKEMTAEEVRGLPPAYGNLDDTDTLPPWARHQDEGPLQVALVKHAARESFKDMVQKIMYEVNAMNQSGNDVLKNAAGFELLKLLSTALAAVCNQMKPVFTCPEGDSKTDRAFYADRVVKLIMEFCWQVVAAFEIRPISVTINNQEIRTRIDISWRDVDNTLTEAIELAFRDNYPRTGAREGGSPRCPQCENAACGGFCVRLNELQTLLEQLKALRSRLERLCSRFKFLSRACVWVGAALETDLVFAASTDRARPLSPVEEGLFMGSI
ncbi:hypothetical protein M409DRAFT_22831 [Zasmidium cellare ATCC 36951]|uniref:Uncharacterized protein n=1 Tax=Zasmidium cellare ATCC 36951 TaxID=1080233 RepID=A0A6A6CHP2_ZASCE|nr:uncharacterized protein M409DRAFT_22831 [Zasmidium cellare ATCC 36951]KAF2166777.1 hypothetical protein M409DRAFT_22831 [Zasmidium cellare ATCC 36951]